MTWLSNAWRGAKSSMSKVVAPITSVAEKAAAGVEKAVSVPVHGIESVSKFGYAIGKSAVKTTGAAAMYIGHEGKVIAKEVTDEAKAGVKAVQTVVGHVVHDAEKLEEAGINIVSGAGNAVKGLGDIVPYLAIAAAGFAAFYLLQNPQILGGKAKRA